MKIDGKKARGVTYDKRTATLTIPLAITDISQSTTIEITRK